MSNDTSNHGPELQLKLAWSFTLSKADTLLVLQALGGRLKPEDYVRATELGDRLTYLRAQEARAHLKALEHAESKIAS
jgi:hypothetical protein